MSAGVARWSNPICSGCATWRRCSGQRWCALILLADPLVMLLLGPQWQEVPHLVRLMAGGMFWLVPAFLSYPTLVVLGRVRDTLTTSLITVPPSLVVLALPQCTAWRRGGHELDHRAFADLRRGLGDPAPCRHALA